MVSRQLHRTRQFIGALNPQIESAELREVETLLGSELMPLFDSMTLRDRRHCIDVFTKLRGSGRDDEDLLVAGLLHDCGKGRLSDVQVRLWHRVAYVLLNAVSPAALRRLSAGRGGLAALANHADVGAKLAQSNGASSRVVQLIREHEDRSITTDAQRRLREADDAS